MNEHLCFVVSIQLKCWAIITEKSMKRFFIAFASLLFVGVSSIASSPVNRTSYNDPNQQFNTNSDKLIFAHVLYRHGDRNIVVLYPNDPNKDLIHWPGGYGQLTNEGKQQLFELGQYFRKRYNAILGPKYSPDNVYIRSTDFDRTLMSAQSNLAGLFMPSKEERFHKKLPWQPVPVHTIPADFDSALFGVKHCPKYDQLFQKYVQESEEVQFIYKEYAEEFEDWSRMCGKTITTIKDCYNLYKTLSIEKLKNKVLPDWALKAIESNGTLEYIANFHHKMAAATPQLARLQSGFLIKEMFEHFSKKINATLRPNRSLWLYSAHETTIANLLNSLGLFELHVPPYASSLHLELFQTSENEHYIQLFYRKSNEENPLPMTFPCGEKCTLNQLYDLYQELIPTDFDSECRLS